MLGGRAAIALVVGTRPEAIKLAPVAAALAGRGLPPLLVLTGQHPGLDPADHGLAGEVLRLGCAGLADPREHAALVAATLPARLPTAPDLLVVQGDTSSALGGALAGFSAGIPVAHVEAGLRSFDPAMPWPEEDNRIAIDAAAELLFAPTPVNAANLRREQVPGAIHVTGNSGIDSLLRLVATLPPARRRHRRRSRLLVTCHRRENWPRLGDVAAALITLAGAEAVTIDVVLHPNPTVAETIRRLLGRRPAIRLVPPLEHLAMIAAMRQADLILSDSGGVQEEAPALGVPLLVLRDKTERPEGIASGNMQLVGTDRERIVAAARRLLGEPPLRAAMSRPALPFGDGRAGERIAAIIARWLEDRQQVRRRA